jgi:hypothetical protein
MVAGTVTQRTPALGASGPLRKVSLAWVANASGAVNGTLTNSVMGMIRRVVFVPGTPAPTNLYDVVLLDEYGYDVLAGNGANITVSGSTPVSWAPSVPVAALGTLELQITGAGNLGQGTVNILMSNP